MTKAYAAESEHSGLAPHGIERRELRDDDVAIDILYCGVCHTDIHYAEMTGAEPFIRWFRAMKLLVASRL